MDKVAIEKWLVVHNIRNYIINEDLSVDVEGSVTLHYQNLRGFPVKFNNIVGDFNCSSNHLTSLLGGPSSVGGDYDCHANQLTTLEGCSVNVGGDFNCNSNKIKGLKGCPIKVGGGFYCNDNKLELLINYPERVGGIFSCKNNKFKDEDSFLYSCTFDQIIHYHANKNLSEKLHASLSEKVEFKKKKL